MLSVPLENAIWAVSDLFLPPQQENVLFPPSTFIIHAGYHIRYLYRISSMIYIVRDIMLVIHRAA
jgi:hypothetical protein